MTQKTDPTSPRPLDIRPEYEALWPKKRRWLRPVRRWLQYWLARFVLALVGHASIPTVQRVGAKLGLLLFRFGKTERAVCEYQLARAFPELPEAERAQIARACFANLGMTGLEALALQRFAKESGKWLILENETVAKSAFAAGKGLIFVTCHSGNWELLNLGVNLLQIPSLAIARPLNNPRLNELVLKARQTPYMEVMQRGTKDSPRQFLTALKQGKAVILLIDQDIDAQNVFVDFFGIPARTPRVAASLALRLNVPVITAFDRRLPDGRHVLRFDEVPVPEEVRAAENPDRAFTQVITARIEAHVRAWPAQWAWNHRRWLHPPEAEGQTSP